MTRIGERLNSLRPHSLVNKLYPEYSYTPADKPQPVDVPTAPTGLFRRGQKARNNAIQTNLHARGSWLNEITPKLTQQGFSRRQAKLDASAFAIAGTAVAVGAKKLWSRADNAVKKAGIALGSVAVATLAAAGSHKLNLGAKIAKSSIESAAISKAGRLSAG